METHQKDKLQLLMIFGSVVTAIMYIHNPVIDTISFQDVVHRFLPFLAQYNPVSISLIFIIICFTIAFLLSDKSIPSKHQQHSNDSKPEPIVQDVIIRTVVKQPQHTLSNSSGHVIHQPESNRTQKTYHPSKQRKKQFIFHNFYDKRNRKRFHW